MTAESPERDGVVLAERPAPGTPRPYDFPTVTRSRLDNGLTVMVADLPGRPLVSATIVVPVGAADEPAGDAGDAADEQEEEIVEAGEAGMTADPAATDAEYLAEDPVEIMSEGDTAGGREDA